MLSACASYWSSTALAFCSMLLPAFCVLDHANLALSQPLMAYHFQLVDWTSILPLFGSMLVQSFFHWSW